MNKIQVLIISQQFLFRQGIEYSLSNIKDIEVSGVAEFNDEELAVIDTLLPDVVLVDIDATSNDSLKLARKIKQRLPNVAIVMLTSKPDDSQLFEALRSQAAAYLCKEVSSDELIDIIRRVSHGEHPINESLNINPKVAEKVLQQFQELSWRHEEEAFIAPLTPREIEILDNVARGLSNKQIALVLNISEQTIKNHVTSILRKLNANARTEAVVIAIKDGLISI